MNLIRNSLTLTGANGDRQLCKMIPTFLKKLLNLFAPNVDVEPLSESKKVEPIDEVKKIGYDKWETEFNPSEKQIELIHEKSRGELKIEVTQTTRKKPPKITTHQKPKRKNKLQRQSRKKNR